ncbi:MAG: hypothetical protein HYW23_00545 [Candidatus Aenigmarchaeota archaeon]|nr:hypothetical protein [Candidatus Aenigmarchaeota archaeon]
MALLSLIFLDVVETCSFLQVTVLRGFEWFSRDQWQLIIDNLKELVSEIPYESYPQDPSDGLAPPNYSPIANRYWSRLIDFHRDTGHKPVFLEDMDTWFRFNQATVEAFKQELRRSKLLVYDWGESDMTYHRKLVKLNEAIHKADIRARKVHEIDRDYKLLEAIARTGVDVAVVGGCHSAYWISNQDAIRRKYGISFDSYSADVPDYHRRNATFTINPSDSESVLDRILLERAVALVETGRLVPDKKPTYVGIWDIPMPSTGYFEMFVDGRSGDKISGIIVDTVGDAVFEGTATPDEIVFTKRYTPANRNAVEGDIVYRGIKMGGDFVGRIHADGRSGSFLMSEALTSPENMSIRFGYKSSHMQTELTRIKQ